MRSMTAINAATCVHRPITNKMPVAPSMALVIFARESDLVPLMDLYPQNMNTDPIANLIKNGESWLQESSEGKTDSMLVNWRHYTTISHRDTIRNF